MNRSQLFFGGLLLLPLFLCGCHSATPPATQPVSTTLTQRDTPPSAVPDQPGKNGVDDEPQPAPPGTAQALAQRAKSYALNMEPGHRRRRATDADSTSPTFADPDSMRFTPQAELDPAGPLHGADTTHVPVANASVSVPTVQHLVTPGSASPPVPQAAIDDSVSARLLARARDYPADLSAQVDGQMLKFVRDQPVPEVGSLGGLAPEDRELLSALMDALTNFRSQLRADNNMLFSKKIHPLVEMADRLRSQAELSVPTIALCTSVKAFGVYEPIDPARFIAGKDQKVIVYCEVENFLSQPDDKNLYQTRLTQDIVLYTESSGLPVWSDKKSTYVDQSRRRRHDFFMGKIITLPANLTIGRYLLKVTVEDQQARHVAENTVPVEIVAGE